MLNVVIVEDNASLRESLVDVLAADGHHVVAFDSAEAFGANCSLASVDIMVLDLNLPGKDGVTLARELRAARPDIGIIMLTARGAAEDRARGYDNGADIYLGKPSSAVELTASIWALARRLNLADKVVQGLVLDPKAMTLIGPAGAQSLTSSEVALLEAFLQAPQNRLDLEGRHGQSPNAAVSKATLGVKIVRLRKKLVAAGAVGQPINAIRNVGYQLSVPVDWA